MLPSPRVGFSQKRYRSGSHESRGASALGDSAECGARVRRADDRRVVGRAEQRVVACDTSVRSMGSASAQRLTRQDDGKDAERSSSRLSCVPAPSRRAASGRCVTSYAFRELRSRRSTRLQGTGASRSGTARPSPLLAHQIGRRSCTCGTSPAR
eukprot:6199042-Pleurochrysis_carterae.AAC.3